MICESRKQAAKVFAAGAFAAAAIMFHAAPALAANSMSIGGLTSQPIGHYEFCYRMPAECLVRPSDHGPVRLTRALWQQMQIVNVGTNRDIRPINDIDLHGKEEVWSYPTTMGDCEDYVLQKRRLLMRSGVSLSNLLITVVRKPDGEGHAILTVRTDKGDFVLDNLSDEIKLWNKTGYHFLKRQASNHTGRWVNIRGSANPLVGSVK